MILNIDTSTDICSVALTDKGTLIAHKEKSGINEHASSLTMLIESMMKEQNVAMAQLDAVAVSSGPGSYTGLRIGVSTAKGICYALSLPLISVPTLHIMAEALFEAEPEAQYALPMLDARRMEVYTQLFARDRGPINEVEAVIIDTTSFSDLFQNNTVFLCGNGSDKCKEVINGNNVKYTPEINPLAQYMGRLSEEKLKSKDFEDVAYFEPFYLKEFVATVAKNKIF